MVGGNSGDDGDGDADGDSGFGSNIVNDSNCGDGKCKVDCSDDGNDNGDGDPNGDGDSNNDSRDGD